MEESTSRAVDEGDIENLNLPELNGAVAQIEALLTK
jgi:hypothetical protein